MSERLQKLIANAGICSRRRAEQLIADGKVSVNDETASLGAQASLDDRLVVDGKQYLVTSRGHNKCQVLLYNKPEGEVTTRSDPEGRTTVFDRLPQPQSGRWVAVGRLDINTSGLLLLTNDGELANALMHPSSQVDREYACRIHGEVSKDQIKALLKGVMLDDGEAHFTDIVEASGASGSNRWFHVALMEGRNREVRRLWASQGVQVNRLMRVRYGAVFLPDNLRQGEFKELASDDIRVLREDIGLSPTARQLTLTDLHPRHRRKAKARPEQRKPGGAAGKPARKKSDSAGKKRRPAKAHQPVARQGKAGKGKPHKGKRK